MLLQRPLVFAGKNFRPVASALGAMSIGEPPSESAKRVETITKLSRQAAFIVLWLTVAQVILKEFGFEVGPILASAGIVGLAVGFGAQNLVRDVIQDFS